MLELSTLLGIALKTSLLLAAAGIAAAAFAKASAAHRHLVWTVVLALAALMPIAILYVPALTLVPVSWPAGWPIHETLTPATHATVATGQAAPLAADWFALSWQALLAIWAAGAIALTLRDAAAHVGLMRWRRRAHPIVSARWSETVARLARTQTLPRNLVILETAEIDAPCTWGVLRPVLLLPVAGEAWSENERRHALVHELAHVRRRDYLSSMIARLCCAVHWYNPLVWFAAAQVRRLQEQAADDAVLRSGGRPSEYAQLLVNIACDVRGPVRVAMGMATRSALKSRVLAILGSRGDRVEPGVFAVFGVLVGLSCVMLFIATAKAAPPKAHQTQSWITASATAAEASDAQPNSGLTEDQLAERGPGTREPVVLVATKANRAERDEETSESETGISDEEQSARDDEEQARADAENARADAENARADAEAAREDADNSQDVANVEDAGEPEADESDVDEPDPPEEPGAAESGEDAVQVNPVVAPPVVAAPVVVPPVVVPPVVTPPVPPRVTVRVERDREVTVNVPAVPAVNTRPIPARNIVVNVPEIPATPRTPRVPARQIRVHVPAIPAVYVQGQPARKIVVRIPVVRVVRAAPPMPAMPTLAPARPVAPTAPAAPAAPAAPSAPAAPAE